jgi:hypothetical protein
MKIGSRRLNSRVKQAAKNPLPVLAAKSKPRSSHEQRGA